MISFTPLLNNDKSKPVYKQLYEYIKEQILEGHILGGTKLPSLRELSKHLHLSKNTIEGAYQQLCAEGYIESIAKTGYIVVDIDQELEAPVASPYLKMVSLEPKDLNVTNTYKFDLASKYGDISCFNINAWRKISNSIMNENLKELLAYGDPQGEYELREEIAKHVYENRGVHCHPDQIIIGAGTQFCLSLLCQMLGPNYGTIGIEDHGTQWIRFVFERYNFSIEPIKFEKNSLDISQLKNSKTKLVFVTPSHHLLKGSVMPVANRLQLLNWANKNQGIIIEDDYDNEIKLLDNPIPALKSLDKNDQVLYLGSFSKIFMSTIRISYMILPNRLINLYSEKYRMYEQTTSKLHQKTLARFIKEGHFEKHVRKIRRHYLNKYNTIVRALNTYMKDKVTIISSSAGLTVFLEIKSSLSENQLLTLAKNAGINIIPVSEYYIKHFEYQQSGLPKVLLSCKGIPIETIEPAIKVLSEAWSMI